MSVSLSAPGTLDASPACSTRLPTLHTPAGNHATCAQVTCMAVVHVGSAHWMHAPTFFCLHKVHVNFHLAFSILGVVCACKKCVALRSHGCATGGPRLRVGGVVAAYCCVFQRVRLRRERGRVCSV